MYLTCTLIWVGVTLLPGLYAVSMTHIGIWAALLCFVLFEGYGPISGASMSPARTFAYFVAGGFTAARGMPYLWFLTARRCASVSVCLSVRLSVTNRCCTETAEQIERFLAQRLPFSLFYIVLEGNLAVTMNKDTTLWNFISNSGLTNFATARWPSQVMSTFRWTLIVINWRRSSVSTMGWRLRVARV